MSRLSAAWQLSGVRMTLQRKRVWRTFILFGFSFENIEFSSCQKSLKIILFCGKQLLHTPTWYKNVVKRRRRHRTNCLAMETCGGLGQERERGVFSTVKCCGFSFPTLQLVWLVQSFLNTLLCQSNWTLCLGRYERKAVVRTKLG